MKIPEFPFAMLLASSLLASCGQLPVPAEIPSAPGGGTHSGTAQLADPAAEASPGSLSREASPEAAAAMGLALDARKQKIEGIATLGDLRALDPGRVSDPGETHPRFVELQKKQMLLGVAVSRTLTPALQAVRDEALALREAREIWPPELREASEKIAGSEKPPVPGTERVSQEELGKLKERKRDLLGAFQKSTEYRVYLAKNQSKFNELNSKMTKLQTNPEIAALQKEIRELRKEVYGE